MLDLRDYQIEAKGAVRGAFRAGRPALLVMATGTGKTEAALGIIRDTLDKGHRVLFVAHRKELVEQPLERFARYFPRDVKLLGKIMGPKRQVKKAFVCASVKSLANPERMADYLAFGTPRLVVWDEAHHTPAATWMQVRAMLDAAPGPVFHLGLTATPEGTGLGALWGDPVFAFSLRDAQRAGFLVEERYEVRRLPEIRDEDWAEMDDEALGDELIEAGIVEHTVASLEPHRGRVPLVFTSNIRQAELTAEALRAAGWKAAALSSETKTRAREKALEDFMEGRLDLICNAGLLTEGTDLARCDMVGIARACRSPTLYVQIVGRAMRLWTRTKWNRQWGLMNRTHERYIAAGGKQDAIVLDFAGASIEHTLDVSALCIEEGEPHDGRRAEDKTQEPQERSAYGGLFAERRRVRAPWVTLGGLPTRVRAADLGHGVLFAVELHEGWRVGYMPPGWRNGFKPVAQGVPEAEAEALGDDVARRVKAAVEERARREKKGPEHHTWPAEDVAALRRLVGGLRLVQEART